MSIDIILKNELDIRTIFKPNGKSSGKSIIYLKGYKTDCVLNGCFLDQVFKIHSCYVIFTSPDKEEVHDLVISLTTENAVLLEEIIIRNPKWLYDYDDDTADHVSNFTIKPPDTISFRFLNNDLWKMEIFERPQFMWSSIVFMDIPFGLFDGENCEWVSRPSWRFKTYFRFNKNSDLMNNKKTIKKRLKTIYQSFTTQKKKIR